METWDEGRTPTEHDIHSDAGNGRKNPAGAQCPALQARRGALTPQRPGGLFIYSNVELSHNLGEDRDLPQGKYV